MPSENSFDIVICGAGIAGVATAYNLAVRREVKSKILLVDMNPPLSLTSDHSSECYRNWWPGPGSEMVSLMNRSIDILEQMAEISGNIFHLNRRGYLYCTEDSGNIPNIISEASNISNFGAGPLRIHDNSSQIKYIPSPVKGYSGVPNGADLILNPDLIQEYFPYLSKNIVAALHVRRAGWLSAQQLGRYMFDEARQQGVKFKSARITSINLKNRKVESVKLEDGTLIHTPIFINAAGPFITDIASMMGMELPIFSEKHLKISMNDTLKVMDRDAPLLIYNDPQIIPWADDETRYFSEEKSLNWLLEGFPPGVHTRPEGSGESQTIIMLWEYDNKPVEPIFPVPMHDPVYHEITLHGLSRMLPKMRDYFQKLPRPSIDGGYYTKTRENRPLIGALPVEGAYIIGALSGFGIMSACGAADLLGAYITKDLLPSYAHAFALDRYQNKDYLQIIENIRNTGQL